MPEVYKTATGAQEVPTLIQLRDFAFNLAAKADSAAMRLRVLSGLVSHGATLGETKPSNPPGSPIAPRATQVEIVEAMNEISNQLNMIDSFVREIELTLFGGAD